MLPIDPATKNYSAEMVAKFDDLVAPKGYDWKLLDNEPQVEGSLWDKIKD